jgi:hypothetical protein
MKLRAESYLQYFKQRVLSALNLSSVDIGEGDTANRSTAAQMSRSLVDAVKADQQSLEEQLYANIIIPLLQESAEDNSFDWLDPKNRVSLRFKEIDIENQLRKENGAIQLWLNNAITHDELRERVGLSPVSDEQWEESYYKMITEAQELLKLGSIPGNALSETSARSPNTPMTKADLEKANQKNTDMKRTAAESSKKKIPVAQQENEQTQI